MASSEQVELGSGEGESYAESADICHETILFPQALSNCVASKIFLQGEQEVEG